MTTTEFTSGAPRDSVDEPQPVEQRGTLNIPADVVAKIAAQAAWEVDSVGSASGGVLGIGARREFNQRPAGQARIFGQSAVIDLDLGIAYPAPLRATAARIREHVIERVEHLTGLKAEQVDIKISWLHRTESRTGRGALL